MDLLIVPVPLFNADIAVDAYYFRYQKGNHLLTESKATSQFDGAMHSPILEILDTVGIEAFTMGKPIVVPITSLMLLVKLEEQCSQPADRIIFLLDQNAKVEEPYLSNIKRLKGLGYRFGLQRIPSVQEYVPLIELCDYVFMDHRSFNQPWQMRVLEEVTREYRNITRVVAHINTMEQFQSLRDKLPGSMFEGRFYRTPLTKGNREISPLQTNLIRLLNLVQDENFEFSSVSTIIQRDPALTISLMRLVNSPYLGLSQKIKTIPHAVTMLGQLEVRKWVTTAVSRLLGSDKPSEITRLSLIRARFAEILSAKFNLKADAQSLFLMGLFSVLDVVLELPMEEALEKVRVTDDIHDALVAQSGPYYPVFQFILRYESADWAAVSRMLILYDISADEINEAYVSVLCWYRDLLSDND